MQSGTPGPASAGVAAAGERDPPPAAGIAAEASPGASPGSTGTLGQARWGFMQRAVTSGGWRVSSPEARESLLSSAPGSPAGKGGDGDGRPSSAGASAVLALQVQMVAAQSKHKAAVRRHTRLLEQREKFSKITGRALKEQKRERMSKRAAAKQHVQDRKRQWQHILTEAEAGAAAGSGSPMGRGK